MSAALSTSAVSGGFVDPILGSQAAFRRIMGAFAEPGTIIDLGAFVSAPRPLTPAIATLLATLADADAPVFLETDDVTEASSWIAFQTGAAVLADPANAAFAVLSLKSDPAQWQRYPVGTDVYPDRSATLILPVQALEGGASLTLSGPGIETTRRIAPLGLTAGFVAARTANRALFPRGHDLVLATDAQCLVLPRTTRVEEA
ncbi:phosphonate C-P lyase system protein PhnH [Aureimonas sp. Leaf324]|jgi:alpha-D-ribose 1-methylphosphonate 5-triphosphate synthase subunit PhnH|uniref:phosphonate C-P lyase system protein PhnH n=1 Tax=Aureimonas sp. Leaf324 TaxID=1736336 RepID=UPI0006FAE960|nr:phosphonate C-P lyase system protein PhnH [Aureimonas sp. Leaf324]KQQ91551.1 phosphonate C-P lyase system protein PhnH [Aureimonas sp. Leaf324]